MDKYLRALEYVKQAEAQPKKPKESKRSSLHEPLLGRRERSIASDAPTPAQLKLYHKAIPLLQKATWIAHADYLLGVLYSRGIVDEATRDYMDGKKGIMSRCWDACFTRPLPQLPKPLRYVPPKPDQRLLDMAIYRLSSALKQGYTKAEPQLKYLEEKKARELSDWEDEVKRVREAQWHSETDKMLRDGERAVREVEEIRAKRAERERQVAANPHLPYMERLEEENQTLKQRTRSLEAELASIPRGYYYYR